MLVLRGYRYRIYPTAQIIETLFEWERAQKYIWNVGLRQRFHALRLWRQGVNRKPVGNLEQQAQLSEARKAIDWLQAVPSRAQQIVLQDLDAAWQMGMKDRERGLPLYKRERDTIGMTVAVKPEFNPDRHIVPRDDVHAIRIPKLGWVEMVYHRPLVGTAKRLSIVRESDDWFVSILCEIDLPEPFRFDNPPAVGIDRGVVLNLADSDGRCVSLPERIRKLARRIDRLKARNDVKILSHEKGAPRSKNWQKGQKDIAKLHKRVRRMRRYWLHQQALYYAEYYVVVVIEDLKVANMTKSSKGTLEAPGKQVKQKAGLNRSILEQGWSTFVALLSYKMEELGGIVVTVPARNTSRTCSVCGHISAENRRSQSKFKCVECGYEENADVNAAREILRRYHNGTFNIVGGYEQRKKPKNKVRTLRRKRTTTGVPTGKRVRNSLPSVSLC